MSRPLGLTSLAAASLFCGVQGCSLQYNGAIGPADDPTEQFVRQHISNRSQAQPPAPNASAASASTRTSWERHDEAIPGPPVVKFETPRGKPKAARFAQQIQEPAITEVSHPTENKTRRPGPGPRPIGLYGQIATDTHGRSSQMDSPDNVRRVTFATEGADFDPAIDPAGTSLVYASTQHRETADLYLKRTDGNTITQLTNDPSHDVMPTFSPDGKRIAFASDRAGNWDIYMIDAGGGQPVQLTSGPGDDLHPSFSPDGKQIVYSSFSEQAGLWELVVIDVENPSAKRFIGFGLFPEWSPTDNRIVFQRARERGTRWFSVWTLELVNGEGVRPTEIAASSNAACITPTWSPDGRFIAFCTIVDPEVQDNINPTQADVWIVRDDGGARANLTNSADLNLQPAWAADRSIYFVSNRAGDTMENIWSVRPGRAMQVVGSSSNARPQTTKADTPTTANSP